MKVCSKCQLEKPLSEFYDNRRNGHKRAACKSCCNAATKQHYKKNKQWFAEYAKKWRNDNRERANEYARHSRQRRRQEIEQAWLARQNGVCGLCSEPPRQGERFELDHDHRTGENRALLCRRCNYLIAAANEDRRVLLAAIDYLDRHGANPKGEKIFPKAAWWRLPDALR
jgi:hypothetical protein